MPTKWLDKSQPQTLYIATLLMYINAVLSLLVVFTYSGVSVFGISDGAVPIGLLIIVGEVLGGVGIANEKNWGYVIALVAALLLLAETLSSHTGGSIINLIFEIALVALLLHPQSREYRRIWFK